MAKVLVAIVFVLVVSCRSLNGSSLKNLDVPNINGTWKNQLGSNVVFQQEGRTIFGKYCTAVSRRLLQRPHFDLIGNIGTGMPTSIGWVVTFHINSGGCLCQFDDEVASCSVLSICRPSLTNRKHNVGWFLLKRFVDLCRGKDNLTISTTGWSGQLRMVEGKQVILTTWILTSPAASENAIWASTRVGKDTFYRAQPDSSCKATITI